eukprot:gene9949-2270_t
MFFSTQIISKKDPLFHIWLAGTLRGKTITKKRVNGTDIIIISKQINSSKDLSLRLSGTLLLGISIIYEKKVNYVHCNYQFTKYISAEGSFIASKAKNINLNSDNTTIDLDKKRVKFDTITIPIDQNYQNFKSSFLDLILPDISCAFEGYNESGEFVFSTSNPSIGIDHRLRANKDEITFFDPDEKTCVPTTDGFEITGKIDVSNILDFEPIGFLEDEFNSKVLTPQETPKTPNSSRKRKMKDVIVDELTEIPFDVMRKYLLDTSKLIVKRPKINDYFGIKKENVFNSIDYEIAQELSDIVNRNSKRMKLSQDEIEIPRFKDSFQDEGFSDVIPHLFEEEEVSIKKRKRMKQVEISPMKSNQKNSQEINEIEISNHKCSMEKKSWKLLKFLKGEMILDNDILCFSKITNYSRNDYSFNFYHLCVIIWRN